MQMVCKKQRGFTAVEIAMVASIIAIIALLVIPIFRQRAEDARLAAVADEIQTIVKASLLIEADLPGGNYLVQLNDFDNRSNKTLNATTNPSQTPTLDPPRSTWNSTTGEFEFLANDAYYRTAVPNWEGPYLAFAFQNTVNLVTIRDGFTPLTNTGGNQGPISIPPTSLFSNQDLLDDKYPIDPWGTPYMLFGPEETIYNVRAVYSLGPNGAPGDNPTPTASDYNRRFPTSLGTADDVYFEF